MIVDGTKSAVVKVGQSVICVKSNYYAVTGDVHPITKPTKAFYSLMVGNGYFKLHETVSGPPHPTKSE